MTEFAYKNIKNASTGHTPFELNHGYYPQMIYKEKVDSCSKSKSVNKLSAKLKELMIIYQNNLHYAQKLQKRAHDKGVKPRSYTSGKKTLLNSNYIKTKQNHKLEAKFFEPFWVLHPVRKQVYKLELLWSWRIHDVFYVSPLEQNTTRKRQVEKVVRQMEFDVKNNNDGEYKVEAIRDNAVYTKEADIHLPKLYHLVV